MDRMMSERVALAEVESAPGFLFVRRREQFEDGDESTVGTVSDFNMPLVRFFLNDEFQVDGFEDCDPGRRRGWGSRWLPLRDGRVGLDQLLPGGRHFDEADLLVDARLVVTRQTGDQGIAPVGDEARVEIGPKGRRFEVRIHSGEGTG